MHQAQREYKMHLVIAWTVIMLRRTKGAVKLHLLLDHDGYLPSVVVITEGRRHDVRVKRCIQARRVLYVAKRIKVCLVHR